MKCKRCGRDFPFHKNGVKHHKTQSWDGKGIRKARVWCKEERNMLKEKTIGIHCPTCKKKGRHIFTLTEQKIVQQERSRLKAEIEKIILKHQNVECLHGRASQCFPAMIEELARLFDGDEGTKTFSDRTAFTPKELTTHGIVQWNAALDAVEKELYKILHGEYDTCCCCACSEGFDCDWIKSVEEIKELRK